MSKPRVNLRPFGLHWTSRWRSWPATLARKWKPSSFISKGLSKNWRWKSSLKPVFPCTLKVRSIGQFHPSRERKLSASRMFVLPVSGSPMNRFTRLQEMLSSRIDLNRLIVSFLIIARGTVFHVLADRDFFENFVAQVAEPEELPARPPAPTALR